MHYLLAWGAPGPLEWIIIAGLGLLIFGKRLPEVGRSLGKGIVEFKKGLKGVEDEISQVDDHPTPPRALPPNPSNVQISTAVPQTKYDPYTGKPLQPEFDPYTGQRITPANTVPTSGTVVDHPEHSEPVSHQ